MRDSTLSIPRPISGGPNVGQQFFINVGMQSFGHFVLYLNPPFLLLTIIGAIRDIRATNSNTIGAI